MILGGDYVSLNDIKYAKKIYQSDRGNWDKLNTIKIIFKDNTEVYINHTTDAECTKLCKLLNEGRNE